MTNSKIWLNLTTRIEVQYTISGSVTGLARDAVSGDTFVLYDYNMLRRSSPQGWDRDMSFDDWFCDEYLNPDPFVGEEFWNEF